MIVSTAPKQKELIMVWNNGDLPANARLRLFYKFTKYGVMAYSPDDKNNTSIMEWDYYLSLEDFAELYLNPRA